MSTINDVAKQAGVSITTVSYVITGKRYVSDNLKERVLQAMKEVGYRPNSLAKSLKSGKTQTVGLI
ncbi:MAG: LacI family transcriptional regulator, partial [Chloroflexi bacterium]|nr:LacI family transcriptional regulator [Chloroflexota bacterium]